MVTNTQKNTLAAPAAPKADKADETSTKGGATLKVRDLRDEYGDAIAGKVHAKLTIIQTAKQRLAQAKDTLRDAKALEAEANQIAGDVADQLYQARREDVLPDAELSAVLGDIFGYKVRPSDGTPSKTPEGTGETIRKRVRFIVAAREAVTGENVSRAFQTLDADQMEAIEREVAAADAGTISIYTAFDNINEIRKTARVTVERAFDPKHIAGLVDALSQEGAADKVRHSEALIAAYTALRTITDGIFVLPEAEAVELVKELEAA